MPIFEESEEKNPERVIKKGDLYIKFDIVF